MCELKTILCDVDKITGQITPETVQKCIKLNKVHLSNFQIAWHYKRYSLGIRTFIIVKRVKDGLIKVYDNEKALKLAKNGFKCPCFMVLEPRTKYQELLKLFD